MKNGRRFVQFWLKDDFKKLFGFWILDIWWTVRRCEAKTKCYCFIKKLKLIFSKVHLIFLFHFSYRSPKKLFQIHLWSATLHPFLQQSFTQLNQRYPLISNFNFTIEIIRFFPWIFLSPLVKAALGIIEKESIFIALNAQQSNVIGNLNYRNSYNKRKSYNPSIFIEPLPETTVRWVFRYRRRVVEKRIKLLSINKWRMGKVSDWIFINFSLLLFRCV